LGVQVQVVPVRDPATELADVFVALADEHVDALYIEEASKRRASL
jgi:hypothetical protein